MKNKIVISIGSLLACIALVSVLIAAVGPPPILRNSMTTNQNVWEKSGSSMTWTGSVSVAGTVTATNGIVGTLFGPSFSSPDVFAAGSGSFNSITSGVRDTAVGFQAGYSLEDGNDDTYVGWQAGYYNVHGSDNVGIGRHALTYNTNGNNTAIGSNAMGYNLGYNDVAIGDFALHGSPGYSAYNMVVIGSEAAQLMNSTGGSVNSDVIIGFRAAYNGTNNLNIQESVAIGYEAGYNGFGYYNTFVGANSGYSASTLGTGNVFLGNQSGYYETGSNKLIVDNTNRGSAANQESQALIAGTFNSTPSSQTLQLGGGGVVTVTGSMLVGGSVNATNGFAVGSQTGVSCTNKVILQDLTTNLMVWTGGILVSNIANYHD